MSATCIFVIVNYLWQIIFQIIICNCMIFNCWLIYIFSFILWITYTYVIVYACLFLVLILVLRRKICVDCIHCTFFIIIPLMNVSNCFNSFGVYFFFNVVYISCFYECYHFKLIICIIYCTHWQFKKMFIGERQSIHIPDVCL